MFAFVLVSAIASNASAQTVSDVLSFLITNQSIDTGSTARDRAAAQAASDTISRALLASLATMPVTSSSGSFLYRMNPELGTVERASQTFSPFFVERALTAGHGQGSWGLTVQHVRFDSLDGQNLRDGTLVTTANQFVDETTPFDVDRLRLNITADVATLTGNLGVTDRVDLGVAIPMVALRVSGSRVNTYRGRSFEQANASATAVGFADAALRMKVLWYDERGGRLATSFDVRLPTGSKADLLGAGSATFQGSLIGSLDKGRLSLHGNLGASTGGFAREITYGAAVAAAPLNRVTFTSEVAGRYMEDVGHIVAVAVPHPFLAGVETTRLTSDRSNVHILSVIPGFKWNLTDTLVLLAHVGVPLTTNGLTSRVMPFVGVDYAVGSIF
jgi:hypothetical protein